MHISDPNQQTCKLDQAIETNVGGWTIKGFGGTLSTRMEYLLSCINKTDIVTMDMVELMNVSKCMYRGGFRNQLLK